MTGVRWIGAFLGLGFVVSTAVASGIDCLPHPLQLQRINRRIAGQVIDYTHNHGGDRRIWSNALQEKRDLYVYLPPHYQPEQKYPLLLWLHAAAHDEHEFLNSVVGLFDRAIQSGELPPLIIAAPDGSLPGRPSWTTAGSFFINTKAGAFEDFIMEDVWNFLMENFPIRPEREAHGLAGASMGGFGAYNLAIKYPDRCKLVVGLFPALNLRWVDCHCRYRGNFDPCCWGWRTQLRPNELIGRIYLLPIRVKRLTDPLFGRGPEVIEAIARENPIEMLEPYQVEPSKFDMYIGYGGRDQLNVDAQVESFLYVARRRGLDVHVWYDPRGRHDAATGIRALPDMAEWLAQRLRPYTPPVEKLPAKECP